MASALAMDSKRWILAVTGIVSMAVGSASAAYLHEARREGMLWVSDGALKQGFVVQQPVAESPLSSAEGSRVTGAPPVQGLFEQDGAVRIPDRRCEGDDAKVRSCERKWEAGNLAKAKPLASRRGDVLTLSPKAGAKIELADWETCSPMGECDGERFLFLGALPRSGALAAEIDYQHDSPSLMLVNPASGTFALVHYGSEPTFLNAPQTLLVSSEDINDATTLIVTRLDGANPSIDLQCLGARTADASFGVTFKGWTSDAAFEVALVKAGKTFAARFERGADAKWTAKTQPSFKGEGFECRQRGATAATAPPAGSP